MCTFSASIWFTLLWEIYALLSVKSLVLKMRGCKKDDKYQVCLWQNHNKQRQLSVLMLTTCNRKVTDCHTRSHLDLAGSGQSSHSRLSDMEDFLDLASQLSKLAQLSKLLHFLPSRSPVDLHTEWPWLWIRNILYYCKLSLKVAKWRSRRSYILSIFLRW